MIKMKLKEKIRNIYKEGLTKKTALFSVLICMMFIISTIPVSFLTMGYIDSEKTIIYKTGIGTYIIEIVDLVIVGAEAKECSVDDVKYTKMRIKKHNDAVKANKKFFEGVGEKIAKTTREGFTQI